MNRIKNKSESEQKLLTLAAEDARNLAAMIRAGLTPLNAWREVDISRASEKVLLPVWLVVMHFGSSPTESLERFATTLDHGSRAAEEMQSHVSGVKLATRVILVLPLVSLGGAWLSGYNPFLFLFGSVLGWVLFVMSCGLLALAYVWHMRILRSAQHFSWGAGLVAEVMCLALTSGASIDHAMQCAREIPKQAFAFPGEFSRELQSTLAVIRFAHTAGSPVAFLVQAEAIRSRNAQSNRLIEQKQKMTVKILLPLGICVLPAFISLGVVPVMVSMLSSTW